MKAQMFLLFSNEHQSDFDATIQKYMGPILRKLQADLHMSSIASDPKQFEESSLEISILLKQYNEHELAEQWKPKNESSLARYAALRNIANTLVDIWLEQPEKLPTEMPKTFCFALAKFDHKKIILTMLEKSFDICREEKNYKILAYKFCQNLINTPHENFILTYMIRNFGKNSPPVLEESSDIFALFLNELHIYRSHTHHIVEKLQHKIKINNNNNNNNNNNILALWIKNRWTTLENMSI